MKLSLMNGCSTETEWLVIVGDRILFRTWRCGSALEFIQGHMLPATSLFKSSNVAKTIEDTRAKVAAH